MRIDGSWQLCDDGAIRPIIKGELRGAAGSWINAHFLVDTSADRTVLSADILTALDQPLMPSEELLGGVGGTVKSFVVATDLRFGHADGGKVVFKGQFSGFTEIAALDMSILGETSWAFSR